MTGQHDPEDHHHAHDPSMVGTAVLTVSSSRTLETDAGGDAVVEALQGAGHEIVVRDLVGDDEASLRANVEAFRAREGVEAIVTTGGTGITADDVTVEALRPLFDREIPGFGERFRQRSVAEVGPHAMLSRATAGICGDVVVFCLPGSENAARFGTRELVVPVLEHAVGLLQGDSHDHGHQDGHEHGHQDGHDHGHGNGHENVHKDGRSHDQAADRKGDEQ